MKGKEYEKIIERLALSKGGAADFLDVDYTTSKRWMYDKHPIPRPVAMLLRVMIKHKLTVTDVLNTLGRSK
jgi:hypothetical protein